MLLFMFVWLVVWLSVGVKNMLCHEWFKCLWDFVWFSQFTSNHKYLWLKIIYSHCNHSKEKTTEKRYNMSKRNNKSFIIQHLRLWRNHRIYSRWGRVKGDMVSLNNLQCFNKVQNLLNNLNNNVLCLLFTMLIVRISRWTLYFEVRLQWMTQNTHHSIFK